MTFERDLDHVLHRMVSDDAADRLLAGDATASDAEGMADLASLFDAARGPAGSDELAGEWAAVTAFTTTVKAVTESTLTQGSQPVKVRRMTGKAAAIVAAATFMSVGTAAAATGTLPDPVQRTVSSSISHVGIDLPKPDDDGAERRPAARPDDLPRPTTTIGTAPEADRAAAERRGTPVGPDIDGPGRVGLCRAFGEAIGHGQSEESTAFAALRQAAAANGLTVRELCARILADDDTRRSTSTTVEDRERPATSNKQNEERPTSPPSTSVRGEDKSTGDTRPSVPTVTTKNEASRANDAPKPTSTTKAENRGGNSNNSNNGNGTGGTGRG